MKHFSLIYRDLDEFNDFIAKNKIDTYQNILVQVFTSHCDKIYIHMLQEVIRDNLPQAKVIGATTSGEINSDGLQENKTIFSISCFVDTQIKNILIANDEYSSEILGEVTICSFAKEDIDKSKVAITFTDGLYTNGEMYLLGINKQYPDLILAGGMAGDYAKFLHTFVFTEDQVTLNGSVMALLINPELEVYNDFSFDWEAVGPKHVVTKSKGNRVYRIDDKTPVEFYKKYLGKNVADALPAIGIEFPLMIVDKKFEIARAVTGRHEDESLSFAGNVQEGSIVKFGFGNVNNIVKEGSKTIEKTSNLPIEGVYIYSCMARKYLLSEHINTELFPLSKIANVAGFFTYGEFFYNHKESFLFNQTMTILGLSETKLDLKNKETKIDSNDDILKTNHNFIRLEALSNLITQTSREFDHLNENLEEKVKDEVEKNLEKDAILEINAKHAQLGELMEMIIHQWRQPLSAMSTIISGAIVQEELGILSSSKQMENREHLLEQITHLNNTINEFRNFFKDTNIKQNIKPSQIIDKVKMFTKDLCKKESIECETIYHFDKDILIDVNKMVQVLMNLTKNSIDALIEKRIDDRKIIVIFELYGDSLEIQFIDNGGGIPSEILPKIFDKRFSTKKATHGTGIGLHMTKTIIEHHMKGSIDVENIEIGAKFSIKIPLVDTEE